jgi:hypothetical protein
MVETLILLTLMVLFFAVGDYFTRKRPAKHP